MIFCLACRTQALFRSLPLHRSQFYTHFLHRLSRFSSIMASKQEWEKFFKDDKFVKNYKTGERVMGQFAQALIEQSGVILESQTTQDRPLVVLDNACGTGIVSSLLHHQLDDKVKNNWKLTCGDISGGMLEYTKHRMEKEKWQNAETKLVDAQATQLPDAHYTHVFTGFAYMALPKSLAALDETCRILQPGGTIAFSTWIEPGWISVVQKAIATIPGNLPFPTAEEFLKVLGNGNWHSTPWIESQLKERGFEDICVTTDTRTIPLSVPEFVEMTVIMFPMVAKFFWTEKQREESSEKVRPALEKYLGNLYGENGEVPMQWTAILSTARKPL